ncbi:UDP-glucose dehydrogenase family protein [Desulfosarcina ovata]|uniref:UDP-glucose 6-dehydrogenase n=1 Tax=Desulfosarcina ovata subsp. ovata TaxID=2752305 RepID=A0A5K8A855_9BACT|nr:UDP-glucose/GDP-mannose dehydrogenase family protein [Desulfosarcina ovata]BBO88598.1 UDP-glucose 6-dehydrogenase [Desulfosarcina ovata subsp. ovata]
MNVCIIGTGYVGLVAAACLSEMGNDVTCIDVNKEIINRLNDGKIHIFEPGLESLVSRNAAEGRLTFSTDLAEGMQDALFIFSCVGTPSKTDGSCDLSYMDTVAEQIGQHLSDYKIIINKSTVPVGTADRVKAIIQKELDQRGVSVEFDVVSNPEFLKEGDAVNDFLKPDRVIVGTDNVRTAKLLETLYAPFARSRDKMIVMGVRSAEMTKYAANCMLATKISFMNEVANLCETVGADVKEVRAGIGSDRRIGYHFIYPGVGYGGSCFPKDVRALINTAREYGCMSNLVEAVDTVNNRQKRQIADKVIDYFSARGGVNGKTVAVWGLSFKANTDDMRESAALDIIQVLTDAGMKIRAYDPVASENGKKILADNSHVSIMDGQYDPLDGADALAVVTDWNQFRNPDFNRIKKMLVHPVIFDGRNLFSRTFMKDMGFSYISVGRQPVIAEGSDNFK